MFQGLSIIYRKFGLLGWNCVMRMGFSVLEIRVSFCKINTSSVFD